jgi:hypothetical protein
MGLPRFAGTNTLCVIAEEVDKVYPELVIRDNAGKITAREGRTRRAALRGAARR